MKRDDEGQLIQYGAGADCKSVVSDSPGSIPGLPTKKRETVAEYGRFSVVHDPLVHMPWGLYRVFAGEKYVGAQVSFPSAADCEWLEQNKGYGPRITAEEERIKKFSHRGAVRRWVKDIAAG